MNRKTIIAILCGALLVATGTGAAFAANATSPPQTGNSAISDIQFALIKLNFYGVFAGITRLIGVWIVDGIQNCDHIASIVNSFFGTTIVPFFLFS